MDTNQEPALIHPRRGSRLRRQGDRFVDEQTGEAFPVVGDVLRMVPEEGYAASFGVEWTRYPRVQLDSANGTTISRTRFRQIADRDPAELAGKRVLDVGCGTGRFMEVVAPHAAEVWGVDKSVAAEVAQANVGHLDNCRVVQADLFELPFDDRFDFIYSIGVIHHTPDPAAALAKLATHLRPGGELCVWVYSLGVSSGIKARWVPRPYQFYVPFVRHLPDATRPALFALYAKTALAAGELPVLGKVAPVFLPIQDLRKKGPLQDGWEPQDSRDEEARERIRFDWAMHSVYDQFTPTFARLQSNAEVLEWGRRAGLVDVRNGPVPATVIGRRPS